MKAAPFPSSNPETIRIGALHLVSTARTCGFIVILFTCSMNSREPRTHSAPRWNRGARCEPPVNRLRAPLRMARQRDRANPKPFAPFRPRVSAPLARADHSARRSRFRRIPASFSSSPTRFRRRSITSARLKRTRPLAAADSGGHNQPDGDTGRHPRGRPRRPDTRSRRKSTGRAAGFPFWTADNPGTTAGAIARSRVREHSSNAYDRGTADSAERCSPTRVRNSADLSSTFLWAASSCPERKPGCRRLRP